MQKFELKLDFNNEMVKRLKKLVSLRRERERERDYSDTEGVSAMG
jgi:hypothetical protein